MDSRVIIELMSSIRCIEARIAEINGVPYRYLLPEQNQKLVARHKALTLTRSRLYESLATLLLNLFSEGQRRENIEW